MSGRITPLKIDALLSKLRKFGVEVMEGRGKGSHIVLFLPDTQGSNRGPQFSLKNHGKKTELGVGTIKAVLRRFNISREDFLKA